MLKKLAVTTNLLSCLMAASLAHAETTCFDLSLDTEKGPSLLRPAFSPDECSAVQNALKTSGKFPNIFTSQGTHLYDGLCFISNDNDPFGVTNGIHAKLGSKAVTINSVSAWTTEFTPQYLNGPDNLAGVITQWTVQDIARNRTMGKVFTTDTIDTSRILTLGETSELDVIIGGTDKVLNAAGSLRVNARLDQNSFVQITEITGKLCIPE